MNRAVWLLVVFFGFLVIYLASLVRPEYRGQQWTPSPVETIATPTPTDTRSMMQIVNDERRSRGLNILVWNEDLASSANRKACEMVQRNYFNHTDPEGNYAWYMIQEEGYNYTHAGENLVKEIPHPAEAMARLMASPKHRDNILDPDFNDIGIGNCGAYTVQHFGSLY